MAAKRVPQIHVLAGVNGAGKSSIGGAAMRAAGSVYFNPDEVARQFRDRNPAMTQSEANGLAWQAGKRLLENAIEQGLDFSFETTLGANTMTELLIKAADAGFDVHVWYAGLASAEQHIDRVRQRVASGGHDIPEADIRRRYETSKLNLIKLMPHLASLRIFDNSADADPATGKSPRPQLVLHVEGGAIRNVRDLPNTPQWAKPLVLAAAKLAKRK